MVHLSAEGLREFMREQPKAAVLDVRSAREHRETHLRGDHHVPWYTADWTPDPRFLEEVLMRFCRDDYIVVLCASGNLACEAAALLEEAGFTRIYTVLGGFGDIREARLGAIARGAGASLRHRPGGPDHEQDPPTLQECPATHGDPPARACLGSPDGRTGRGQ